MKLFHNFRWVRFYRNILDKIVFMRFGSKSPNVGGLFFMRFWEFWFKIPICRRPFFFHEVRSRNMEFFLIEKIVLICIPICCKKVIIFVGNIYFQIQLKVYLLFTQKLFLLYVNQLGKSLLIWRSYHFFIWMKGLSPILPICFSALYFSYL